MMDKEKEDDESVGDNENREEEDEQEGLEDCGRPNPIPKLDEKTMEEGKNTDPRGGVGSSISMPVLPSFGGVRPPPVSGISPPTGQPVPSPPHGSHQSPPKGSHRSLPPLARQLHLLPSPPPSVPPSPPHLPSLPNHNRQP
ncbi:hypothetical protein L1987_13375 [Smallanthus sonchifolius]|uniref:Uncharacterized protein n=1 Tax=Smallanthus sonchifolius TaxID=185202 RepID=A0ACB9JGC6_9ASTR|nr:hypothetical protein L1987_13375 [Smallanthus sonchifolius]